MKTEPAIIPDDYEITSMVGPGWRVTIAPKHAKGSFQTFTGHGLTQEEAIRNAVESMP